MREYAAHGETTVVTRTSDGGLVFIENTDAIFAYASDLVTPSHVGVVEYLSLRDTLAVKEKILDFFADARAAGATLVPDSSWLISTGSGPETSPV